MNREMLTVRPSDSAEDALLRLLAFKVSGAPVVGDAGELVGVVSWRDLVGAEGLVQDFMSAPAVTVPLDESVESAAWLLAQSGKHRLIAVEQGRPLGVVSSLDVIRGLLGLPSAHPDSFPHFDPDAALKFTDDLPLSREAAHHVPEAEGLLVLVQGGKNQEEQTVWVEACSNLRAHVHAVASDAGKRIPHLAAAFERGELRFRVAIAPDVSQRMKALRTVLYRARDARRETMHHGQEGV
jgi:hypothetical protein